MNARGELTDSTLADVAAVALEDLCRGAIMPVQVSMHACMYVCVFVYMHMFVCMYMYLCILCVCMYIYIQGRHIACAGMFWSL